MNNRTIFYIILIALLIGINVFLYVKYNQKSNENEKLTEQVNQDSIRISQLTAAYDSAVVEVQSYKMQRPFKNQIRVVSVQFNRCG